MKTLQLTNNNDLALTANPAKANKKTLTLETDSVVAGLQKLYLRFQFFEGEWFLDKRQGTPYMRLVFGKKEPDFSIVRRLVYQIILSVNVVAKVTRLDFSYDRTTRTVSFDFEAIASDGRKVLGGLGKPFIVDDRALGISGDTTK